MEVFQQIAPLRVQIANWRKQNERIAFVPTMGNLHEGHLSLVQIARQKAEHVVVSIYVNPLQFAPGEDFSSYPRTLQDDLKKLDTMDVDLVFTPDSSVVYPEGEQNSSFVEVPGLSDILEGEFRPGFFRGVATVVLKLFNIVQPDIAVFGEKDYQQLLVIRQMVRDFCLPVQIIGGEIKRESSGLAMSSRNNYLTADERENGRLLSVALADCRDQVISGIDIRQAEMSCTDTLQDYGFVVDYVSLREASALNTVSDEEISAAKELIILAAAKMGSTRLIDNLKFSMIPAASNRLI